MPSPYIHFSKMPNVSIPRSRLKLIQPVKMSFDFGKLVPIDALPVMPGDDLAKIELKGVIRMSQPIVPIMDDIEANFYAFFVPSRILWDNFENWFTTGDKTKTQGSPVQLSPTTANAQLPYLSAYAGIAETSIAHYFGKPVVAYDGAKASSGYGAFNVMKERAYFKIWTDWFIPSQVVTAVPDVSNSGTYIGSYVTGGVTTNVSATSNLLPVCKSFDYFTAGTISPQYATGNVTIPLGTSAPLVKISDSKDFQTPSSATAAAVYFKTNSNDGQFYTGQLGNTSAANNNIHINEKNFYVDLQNATAATINSLREAFAVQKYCERSNYGNRFFEAIISHYGTSSPDARLQRAEYIGHYSCLINVDQIVSTAGYNVGTSQEVGAPGAISVTGFRCHLGSKGFVEPGYVVILMSTRQKYHTYSQGILREDSKLTKWEFYSPEFAFLGDQEIKNKEIFLQGTSTDNLPFAYQEHWAEDRYRSPRAVGKLNPNVSGALDYWTLADKFASLPALGSTFLFENRDNIARCLATAATGPDFIGDFRLEYIEDTTKPVYSIPGLIDHFGTH